MRFRLNDDVLVVMLGDGVDAIVNPKMPEGVVLVPLRAMKTPGLVRLGPTLVWTDVSGTLERVLTNVRGQLRRNARDGDRFGAPGRRGTAGWAARDALHATDTGTTCTDSNKMYCWMRCMTKVDCSSVLPAHTRVLLSA